MRLTVYMLQSQVMKKWGEETEQTRHQTKRIYFHVKCYPKN